ncbi:anthranilate phosphoribosyltransferase [Aneurinibacillus aneurinilyticus]|uniref:anthranilate phosphoribosyltransferase n=1 Tax=Aneurinibacillus aneurinilyticus TaxID=1391 RepID=UPI002E24C560|nr:anthranilate phosphoribosyltransferase [Aneurinibacillus aneurinilyticus]
MRELLKEVARGKKGAKNLSYEQSLQGAKMILSGEATPAQTAAFFVAERIKMETADELLAFVEALREHSLKHAVPQSIDCAGPYDGRKKSFFANFPAAFVTAACGVPVTLHSGDPLPPKWGITLSDILNALSIQARGHEQAFVEASHESGVLYVHAETWNDGLARLRPLREELGFRTMLNTVEKLLRYSDAPYMAAGVFHGTVFEKMAEMMTRLGVARGIVVQGMEGSEDVPVHQRTRTLLVSKDSHELFIIDPEALGLQTETPELEWSPRSQAAIALDVLKNEAPLPFFNLVLLNSAIRLWVAEKVPSIEAGIKAAKASLTEGHALEKFEAWRSIVQQHQTLTS